MDNGKLRALYDTMYDSFGPQHWWPGETPFEVAVGAVLTQNTNWENVVKAINNLKASNALNPYTLHNMPDERLAGLIRPSGYFNVKTKRLKSLISFLITRYGGVIEDMERDDTETLRNDLLNVNGIGAETADSILLYAINRPIFVIDAYTKRILGRHGIMGSDRSYDDFQAYFHKNLPKDTALFNEYHALIVRTGKLYCKPKEQCAGCPLDKDGLRWA